MKKISFTTAFARSVSTGMQPMNVFLVGDFAKLWKLRLQFPWTEPTIFGKYMRTKANEDLRGMIAIIRANKL